MGRAEHRPNGLAGHWHLPTLLSPLIQIKWWEWKKDSSQTTLQTVPEKEMIDSFMVFLEFKNKTVFHTDKSSLYQEPLKQEYHFNLLFERTDYDVFLQQL